MTKPSSYPKDARLIDGALGLLRLHALSLTHRIFERLSADPELAALAQPYPHRREELALAIIDCASYPTELQQRAHMLKQRTPLAVLDAFSAKQEFLAYTFKNALQDVFAMGDADPVLGALCRGFADVAAALRQARDLP
jgi:hypothetical protein